MSYVDVEKGEGHILKMIIEMSFCLHIQDDIVTIYMNRSSRTAVYLTLERLNLNIPQWPNSESVRR